MDTLDAIKSRRAVRAWTDEDISEEILSQILEAGRWSPSPLNSQPWHFTIVRNRETINTLCANAKEGSFLRFAKVCIVISVEKEIITPEEAQNNERLSLIAWLKEHDQYVYSGVCALQNMWLTSWSLGIGACWVTLDKLTTQKLIEIPENQVLIGGIALGHILGNPVPHRDTDRKPLTEMVFFEKYGNTFKNGV